VEARIASAPQAAERGALGLSLGSESVALDRLVLDWWLTSGVRRERDLLPWRSVKDPWLVLLAEVMLTQTQAARVAQRYGAFVSRFPSAPAMARAPVADVLRSWSGLGYNGRAVRLHAAASLITERHGGEVPARLDALVALPGIGPYCARAVLAFGFGIEAAPVDTNIGRVLARAVAGSRLRAGEAQRLADSLVPAGDARCWSLALMDLGASLCVAREPRCSSCPIGAAGACAWRAAIAAAPVRDRGADPADPARGTAAASRRQGRFEGSDRQGRGRLLRRACDGPIRPEQLAAAAGWQADPDRATRIAADLVAEGLASRDEHGGLRLG
jgi:A/G-specific adenine glycosylase